MTSPQPSYLDLINQLRGAMPINVGGYSDDLNRAWIAAQQQQGAAALQAATQFQLQNQTNQMRMYELMGGQPVLDAQGNPVIDPTTGRPKITATDAAQRWRSELTSQQDVQNERLRQEQMQMLGFGADPNDPSHMVQTLGARTLAQQATESLAERNMRLQLQREQSTATASESSFERQLRQAMQGTQYSHETAMQQGLFGQQTALQQGQFGQQTSERLGTQQFQGQESAYERALRQAMQAAEFTQQTAMQQGQFGQQTSERLGTQQFQTGERVGTQQWQAGENQLERQLRLQLQSGQLNQQESEFARSYILQQQEGRRQEAALSGQLDSGQLTEAARAARVAEAARMAELSGSIGGGQLTEQARAAREQEKTQRAQLAAQLLNAPKDVFRAGAFFRSLNGGNQANMGFGGGGISGFNGLGNRLQGTGGTASPDDVYGALGYGPNTGATMPGGQAMSAYLAAPQAQATTPGLPAVPTNASGANSPVGTVSSLWGGGGGGSAADVNNAVDQTMGQAAAAPAASGADASTAGAATTDEEPGSEPGGPVGEDAASLVRDGLGDLGLGMGAGGTFPGRVPPGQQGMASQPTAPIPYVDPATLEDPAIKAMFEDMRQQGLRDAAGARRGLRNGKKASKVDGAEGGLTHMSDKLASGQAASNERYLRGLSRLAQRGALPGMGPGGPVDAPLFPTDGGGAGMPSLQDAGSLGGGGSSFATPAPPTGGGVAALGLGAPAASSFGSIDPYQQAQAQNTMNDVLMRGIGNLGPQELEKMSKTQRGLAEGAAGAAGINWDDLEEAYAATRFNNVGSALLA